LGVKEGESLLLDGLEALPKELLKVEEVVGAADVAAVDEGLLLPDGSPQSSSKSASKESGWEVTGTGAGAGAGAAAKAVMGFEEGTGLEVAVMGRELVVEAAAETTGRVACTDGVADPAGVVPQSAKKSSSLASIGEVWACS
jgi:hypothetical protein